MREDSSRRRPVLSRVVSLALVAVMVLVAAGWVVGMFPSISNPFRSERVDRTQPSLLEAIGDLSEYRAATGQFQVIVDVEDRTRFVPTFIRGERTTFLAGGNVAAGVDFSGLDEDAIEVSEDGRTVRITLPAAELADPVIEPERSFVINRERGALDRIGSVLSDSPTSERELYLLAADELAEAARQSGLRERAEQNTREMLETMLRSLGYERVTVVFNDPSQRS
ncbi:MAG TPA: DUF4230 domain-containing protein [Acidimicrobiales bacterium]|nr:DUF4230 domain-containing protein [Acidimicrobiales bacterium]